MALDTTDALAAVALALLTGKELTDERKRLTRYSPTELRDLLNLQCELQDPDSAPTGKVFRALRLKL